MVGVEGGRVGIGVGFEGLCLVFSLEVIMGWGDPDELVELHGASGKTWQLQFVKQIWPKVDTPDAASTVYMMKEVGKGKMFVAKTQFADTPEEFEDLVAEAAAWRKINVAHQNQWPPHIVELQDVFITRGADSSVVYLMELCQKGNLPRKLPDDKVLEVIKAITEGVKSVMESGLPLHGNISYANALVTGAVGFYRYSTLTVRPG